jgi:hypothetical protein
MQKALPKSEQLNRKNQGMNWISQHKRLAIYLRDGLACAYCNITFDQGATLTLDHINPTSFGGKITDEKNLVTCCHTCNSSRGNRSVEVFAEATACYLNHGKKAEDILNGIKASINRPLNTKAALIMVKDFGSCLKVLNHFKDSK